jgi:hypothetical protein
MAYRCVRNFHGPLSAWNQQRFILDSDNREEDPIEAFDHDIFVCIKQWIEAGEHIILGIDVNEDIRSGSFARRIRLECGLQEIMIRNFGQNLPHTYARGSSPIDGLFVSSSLINCSSGYTDIVCDHRMLWIDVPTDLALGYTPAKFAAPSLKRLILQDPRVVKNYNKLLKSKLEGNSVLPRIQALENSLGGSISKTQIHEYDLLDKLRIEAILAAEKGCRKLRMGVVPYSPNLALAGKKIRAWKLLLKKKSGGAVHSKYLARKLKEADIADIDLLSTDGIRENLRNAWQRYRILKKRASGDRATWIEDLATAWAAEGKTSVASELRNIKLREAQRRDARLIKSVNGDSTRTGLYILRINDGQDWIEVTEKEDMEKALLRESQQRFNQAKETPFCTNPLLEAVGPVGISDVAQQILNGTFTPPENCDPWARKLIPHLQYAVPPISFPVEHLPHQHSAGWKKVRERTSAGISGLTIPQLKAHLLDEHIVQVDATFARLPYQWGFSPSRWRKGIDVMLEKKKDVYNIDKLRAILLYEADFNQNNKKLGRQMLAIAEQFDAIAPEQFGSRKFLSAVDQSLNKALTFDLWRQHCTCAALCSNDAKGCYDRIVHNVASLCMQCVRVPREPIISMFGTIQELQHHVRTAFGDSKKFFAANTGKVPIQGVSKEMVRVHKFGHWSALPFLTC